MYTIILKTNYDSNSVPRYPVSVMLSLVVLPSDESEDVCDIDFTLNPIQLTFTPQIVSEYLVYQLLLNSKLTSKF